MDDLDNIIKKSGKKSNTVYNKYNPLSSINDLLIIINKESEQFKQLESITWNKLNNGTKKKYIFDYLNKESVDNNIILDITRNIYNDQLGIHYDIEYNNVDRKIISINKI
jgi:hypothetical protein